MDQFSLFSTSETAAYELVLPQLSHVIASNWLDNKKLKLNKNKDYYSIAFGPYLVAQIHGDTKPWICIPRLSEDDEDNKRIQLNDLSEVVNFLDQLCSALQSIIDSIPTEFSCCSRYEECSDAIACTNPDKELATGCSYRKTLHIGKVFYGKNRNIDKFIVK